MKVTLFTSNQPRHLRLIKKIASISEEVFVVSESNTVFPGRIADFYSKSPVMQEYFENVLRAERDLSGNLGFSPSNVRYLALKAGDLSNVEKSVLTPALSSDFYIVFGASYIKGWLASHLEAVGAINIHMGLSPYYRGSSCNFWAMYDDNPGFVGATLHRLTTGLDSGPMIKHVRPDYSGEDNFTFTMKAVTSAQDALVTLIMNNELEGLAQVDQDKALEIRYTRNSDFTDQIASEYMRRENSSRDIRNMLKSSQPQFLL